MPNKGLSLGVVQMTTVGSIRRDHLGRNLHKSLPGRRAEMCRPFTPLVYTVALFQCKQDHQTEQQ